MIPLFNETRAGTLSNRNLLVAWVLVNAVLGVGVWYVPIFRRLGFALLVVAYSASERLLLERHPRQMRTGMLFACIGSLVLAFGIWNLDRHKIVCDPDHLVQGHAIWHLLCCAAIYFVYRYYLSERPIRSTPAS